MGPNASKLIDQPLVGERVALLGPLESMARRKAASLVEQHGGSIVPSVNDSATLVVVGDATTDWRELIAESSGASLENPSRGEAPPRADFRVVTESELWRRIGLLTDGGPGRLYTVAMLAELVGAPPSAIRRWHRRGYLRPADEIGRLPYFAMSEVHIARNLAELLDEGGSLSRVDRLVASLAASMPEVERPLADLAVVVQRGRVYLRRGDDLTEPSGQLLLDFDVPDESTADRAPALFKITEHRLANHASPAPEDPEGFSVEEARALAVELEAQGDVAGAVEACRTALFAGGAPEDHALLAELLYRSGDLSAARERYYAALELDEDDIESRISLGCLLIETGELPLAEAAFRGAIAQSPNFADAHYHLAKLLDESGRAEAAADHWRTFLGVAPPSPWTEEARDRLSAAET